VQPEKTQTLAQTKRMKRMRMKLAVRRVVVLA
jgi:hypothetical protein